MDFFRGDALNLRNRISRVLPDWDATRARLLVRARHARVRPRGDEPVRRSRGDGAQGARVAAARRLGGARGRARDGDAGPHRRRHRVPAVARAGLGAGQRLRVPQLLAPRAVPHGRRRATTARSRSTIASIHPEPAPYLLSLVDATALLWRLRLEGVDVGDALRARRRRLAGAHRRGARLLRVQRRARRDGVRRDGPRRASSRA